MLHDTWVSKNVPHKSHQIWLLAPPMPRSALSSTLVVGVISFPMDCTKILEFLWPENQRQLSLAQPTVTVPVVILLCLLEDLCCSHQPHVGSHQLGLPQSWRHWFSTSEEILSPAAFCPWEFTQFPGTTSSAFFSKHQLPFLLSLAQCWLPPQKPTSTWEKRPSQKSLDIVCKG